MKQPIYLDFNGTTPLDPEVVQAMQPFWGAAFGNPSSSHAYGMSPREAVTDARLQVARLLVELQALLGAGAVRGAVRR